MLKDFLNFLKGGFETHTNRKIGFLLGLFFGAAILAFGFFPTIFAIFCGVIGLYIGSKFDDGDDLIDKTLKSLEKILPERFQRW